MPKTKTQDPPAARRRAAARTPDAANTKHDGNGTVERSAELSEDVLQELEDGAKSAIDAVRKFLVTVDEALPPRGEGPSRREEITDSALEMAQRLVHTQSVFLRKVVDSAGKTLSRPDNGR